MKRSVAITISSFGAIIAVPIVYLMYLIHDGSKISNGVPIPNYDHPATALLVIDIQEGTTGKHQQRKCTSSNQTT